MVLIGLSQIEQKLLETGLSGMTLEEKNSLVSTIARKEGKSYFEVGESFILEYHKQLKIDIFSEKCDEEIVNGFVSTNGHTYRTNRDDQTNMIGKALETLIDPAIASINWKTEDVGYVPLTKEEWINQVFKEGLGHKETILYKYNVLKKAIIDATTEPELLSIKWEDDLNGTTTTTTTA